VFSNVQGHFRPTHDEKFAKNIYVLVQTLEECNPKVFGTDRLNFQIACKLDSIAPSMCAPWLSMLKSLASSSFTMPKIMQLHLPMCGLSLVGEEAWGPPVGVFVPWLLV
jgi:hypothetical protein